MKRLSPQTKSFIIILTIVVVGIYLCLTLAMREVLNVGNPSGFYGYENSVISTGSNSANLSTTTQTTPDISTADWKTYNDAKYGFSFKYAPSWKIVPGRIKNLFYTLEINPGGKYSNIKIYVSSTKFYYMDALPTTQVILPSGALAQDVSDLLYGIRHNKYFYTFDIGTSLSLKPQFNALVHSVTFTP